MPGKRGRPRSEVEKVKLQLYLQKDLYDKIAALAEEGFRPLTDQARMMFLIALKKIEEDKKRK